MPIYEYQAVSKGCDRCTDRLEAVQRMGEAPLSQCPHCGAPLRKLVSRFAAHHDALSASNLKDKGFHKLVRKEKGVYEKVV